MSRLVSLFLLACALSACADDRSDPPTDGDVQRITGNERIGWLQTASSAAELAEIRFIIYVDNAPTELQEAGCSPAQSADGFGCASRLPPLPPGRHTLEISSYRLGDAGERLESPRSASLVVQVGQAALTGLTPPPIPIVTADGLRLVATPMATGLENPTDLAVSPDGRVFISERAGRVRVVRDGALQLQPAIELDDVVATGERGLLALAIDPSFAKTGYVFAVYTADDGFRLARFRALGDALGERAILLDGIDAVLDRPAATLRFGPDGKLYLGIDDAGDPVRPGDIGSFNGKVLRLNVDGTTPPDQASGTPVYALHVNEPRGMDWDASGMLWIAEAVRLQAVGVQSTAPARATAMVNYHLPPDIGPGALLFYRGGALAGLAGDLLLASEEARAILRLRIDRDNRRTIVSTEYLLRDAVGGIRTITAGPEGLVYFATATELFALLPQPPGSRDPLLQN
jgi:glucose/arabinose dehydrogenase